VEPAWLFVVNFKVVARIAVKCDGVLCPVQFLFLQKMTYFKNNAHASSCFILAELVQKPFRYKHMLSERKQ